MKTYILGAALLALGLLTPNVAAHPVAIAIDNPLNGTRCYVYEDDGVTEIWRESNGVLSGGVDGPDDLAGASLDEPGSGLQRGPFEDDSGRLIPADTLLADPSSC